MIYDNAETTMSHTVATTRPSTDGIMQTEVDPYELSNKPYDPI